MILERYFDNDTADYKYRLKSAYYTYKSNDHSCYLCEGDWKAFRVRCRDNKDSTEYRVLASGDADWANRISKHYTIKIEQFGR